MLVALRGLFPCPRQPVHYQLLIGVMRIGLVMYSLDTNDGYIKSDVDELCMGMRWKF